MRRVVKLSVHRTNSLMCLAAGPGWSQASTQERGCRVVADSRMSSHRSRMSIQWYSSHLPGKCKKFVLVFFYEDSLP